MEESTGMPDAVGLWIWSVKRKEESGMPVTVESNAKRVFSL